jgi:hypothetical protein
LVVGPADCFPHGVVYPVWEALAVVMFDHGTSEGAFGTPVVDARRRGHEIRVEDPE